MNNEEIIQKNYLEWTQFPFDKETIQEVQKLKNDNNSNIEQLISSHKPPIFWKDKEIIKNQIKNWKTDNIKNLIFKINEIELISNWEISNNILVFGKISKDEARNFTRDLSYGIEYSNCCLKIGLMKRKWTDQNLLFEEDELERIKNLTEGRYPERKRDNVYVFFELVELGRFGKKISDVLKPKKFQ